MSKTERAYHDNGTIRFESEFIDGVPHGLQRHWHENGVLATEMPFDHGIIDGTVKQWNDKGELLGSYNVNKGTGTQRVWHQNGQLMGETSMIDGKWTGRQLAYFDNGELAGATYWLENEKVSKKRYHEACKQNPNLPQYEDDRKLETTCLPTMAKMKSVMPAKRLDVTDELPLKLLQGPYVREALAWLQERRQPSRSLGEATGQDQSIQLVEKLYRLGALAVHAVEIDGEPAEDQNTGHLVIELPQDQERRAKLLKFCGNLAQDAGFDPEPDIEQRYILVMLD